MEYADRISALPDEVIHQILSYLKVEEAAPTMILSKRWRFLWTFNPNLRFGGEYWDNRSTAVIDECIKQYRAKQVRHFCIQSTLWKVDLALIHQCLDFVVAKKVTHLNLQGNWFTVPVSLFASPRLQSVVLANCYLHCPTDIKCFDSLKNLSLYNISDPDGAVQALLSKCKRLQTLFLNTHPCPDPINACISLPDLQELYVCFRCCNLRICAPNLQSLEVHGDISGKLDVASAPRLKRAHFAFRGDFRTPADVDFWGSIMQNIGTVETLLLTDQVLLLHTQYCSKGKRFTFKNLKVLHLQYHMSFPNIYPRLVCLFQDCPSLEEIHVDLMVTCGSEINWEDMNMEGPPEDEDVEVVASDVCEYGFDNLKLVKMVYFSGCEKQKALVKFLLEKAPVLESLHIVFNRDAEDKEKQLDYMALLPKVSPNLTIEWIPEFSS